MDIEFEKAKHEELANDHDALRKKFNKDGVLYGEEIITVLTILSAAPSLYDVPRCYHPHPLSGKYKGSFAVDIEPNGGRGKYRMIFRPGHKGEPSFRIDNYKTITLVVIEEIFKDYH